MPALDDLRRLADAATDGPWEHGCGLQDWAITTATLEDEDETETVATSPYAADAEFIAALNPATVRQLLDEVERLRSVAEAAWLPGAIDAVEDARSVSGDPWDPASSYWRGYRDAVAAVTGQERTEVQARAIAALDAREGEGTS